VGAENDRPWIQAQIDVLLAQLKKLEERVKKLEEDLHGRPPLPDLIGREGVSH
jgi:tetrahydromethanopterin S-methyltransferase subunit B